MRIENFRKQTPQSAPPNTSGSAGLSAEEEHFVWEKLAPRLLHPSKLAFIYALLEHGRPLTLGELAEAAKINEEHARYQAKSMKEAGALEIVRVAPRADGKGDEPSYFFPMPPQAATSPPSATA
jgi:DNA-binding transcriptional ArsR family regulator